MNNSHGLINRLAFFTLVVLYAFVASCGGGYSGGGGGNVITASDFTATLFGAQEVANIATPATGSGSLNLSVNMDPYNVSTNTVSGTVVTTGIAATAAHIHEAAGGINGPIIIPLTESPAGSGVWSIPAGTTITDAQVASLRAGNMYFNVHSAANPSGEIRGQIGRDVRTAALTGAQEVPANVSTATGKGVVIINPATKNMSASVTTAGITGAAAHIHEEAVGVSGGIIFPLSETALGSGIWTTTATLTDAQYTALKSGRYYFNVHSAAFGAGEIRGQIGPVLGATSLTGAQEVPANASTATGTGIAAVDPVTLAISAGLKTTGIVGATVAHVHEAAVGVSGTAIVPLTETPAGNASWNAAAGAVLTPTQFASMLAGNLYFNAHSGAYPAGEIRGQISLK
jgi:CHRD domain